VATFITGVFYDPSEAEGTVEELEELGYARGEISVITNDGSCTVDGTKAETPKKAHVDGDIGFGATYGGALGAILAGVAATGVIVATGGAAVPIVAGPIAAALAGLGAGSITGGVVGALVGLGVPEGHAKRYHLELQDGAMLIGVTARAGEEERVRAILEDDSMTLIDDDDPGRIHDHVIR
jgi:hypothetical protein